MGSMGSTFNIQNYKMPLLLIETATTVCSVALSCNGAVVEQRESDQPNAHSSRLATFVDDMFKKQGMSFSALDGICVSSGPGSYTGLRIGVSYAKGLCYALDIPLLAVPTLQSMAAGYFASHPDYEGLVCPMLDARRMECYTAIYARAPFSDILEVREVAADIVEPHCYDRWLADREVLFLGDGAEKTRPILGIHPNARYDTEFRINAASMLPIAQTKLEQGRVEDVAYFEPFYLKDFVAKKSVVRGLRDN